MAINGRINVDVLFHDTDGTTSLKVVSLEDSTEYTTGKVALITGTCSTAAGGIDSLNPLAPAYMDSSGNQVSFTELSRIALVGHPAARIVNDAGSPVLSSNNGEIAVTSQNMGVTAIRSTAGTASYTIVLYGT